MTPGAVDVAVLVASRWAGLERFDTRWRRVLQAWAADPRVGRLTVVDLPWFTHPLTPGRRLVARADSWLPGTGLLQVKVPAGRRPLADRAAWARTGKRLRAVLAGGGPPHLVVATTPVSAPLLAQLACPATRTAFDAVDVWRMRHVGGAHPERVRAGYAAGLRADRVTGVSATITARLAQEGARDPVVVPNGVDLAEYAAAAGAPPDGLPTGPFCLYVGTVGHRLDRTLMHEVWSRDDVPPLVLAGPAADAEHEDFARTGPWRWLGPVPPESLPALLARASAAVLPQRDTPLTEAQDYMKLLQYLASGTPVASTPLPGLPPDVLVGAGAPAFADAVQRAARTPRRTTRHPLLEGRDWAQVASRLLEHYLPDAV